MNTFPGERECLERIEKTKLPPEALKDDYPRELIVNYSPTGLKVTLAQATALAQAKGYKMSVHSVFADQVGGERTQIIFLHNRIEGIK